MANPRSDGRRGRRGVASGPVAPTMVAVTLSDLTPAVGQVVTATPSAVGTGPITYAYEWRLNGVAIPSETSSTYTPVSGDVGDALTCVVTPTNIVGTGAPLSSAAATPGNAPVITSATVSASTVTVGTSVSVSYTATGSGTLTPSYQWRRNGTPIVGATSSSYTAVVADLGATLTCLVTVTSAYGVDTEVSDGSVADGTAPVITDLTLDATSYHLVGTTVTASVVTTGTAPITVTYQWTRNGVPIAGATSASYTTVTADAGTTVRCQATATNAVGSDVVTSSESILPGVAPSIVSATLPATAAPGDLLSVTLSTTGTAPITTAYQWRVNGVDVDGETAATYANEGAFGYGVSRPVNGTMGLQTISSAGGLPATGTLLVVFDLIGYAGGYNAFLDIGSDGATITTGIRVETVSSGKLRITWWDPTNTIRHLESAPDMPTDAPFLACFKWNPTGAELTIWQDGARVGAAATAAHAGPNDAVGTVRVFPDANAGTLGWAVLDEEIADPSLVDSADYAGPYRAAVALGALWGSMRVLGAEGGAITPSGLTVSGQELLIDVEGLGVVPSDWETEAGAVDTPLTVAGMATVGGDVVTCVVDLSSSWGSDADITNSCTLSFTGVAANATAVVQNGATLELVGTVLTVTSVTLAAGTPPVRYAYQWYRDGDPIVGQTSDAYTSGAADENLPVYVGVVARNLYGTDTEVVSNTTDLGYAANVSSVALDDYTVSVGAVVTATPTTSGTGLVTTEYRWKLDGSIISGATSSTYTTTAAGELVCEARASNPWGTSAWVASPAATVTVGVVYGIQRDHQTTSDTVASVDNSPVLPASEWTWMAYVDFTAYGTSGSNAFIWNNGATDNQFGVNMVTTTTPDRARGIYRDTIGSLRTFDVNYPAGVDITTYGPHLISITRGSTGVVTLRITKAGTVVASGNGGGTNTFGNGSATGVITALTNMAGVMAWAIGNEALDAAAHSGLVDATATPRDFFNGRGTLWAGWQVNAADEATIDPATDVVSIGSGLSTAWVAVGSSGGLSAEGA